MSTAHRPTWEPAKARPDSAHISHQVQRHYIASHTKLKFRQPDTKRDLKKELAVAERETENKKRAAKGLPPIVDQEEEEEDEESRKRRKVIQEARQLDRDDEDDEQDESPDKDKESKDDESTASESESDSDDDEDETALLLAELEKIKRERAAEKARQESLEQSAREDEIALGNPLLNLENSFQNKDFGVKRRWDDDVIFKNQAAGNSDKKDGGFVNDLTRTEFHRKFINRYIK